MNSSFKFLQKLWLLNQKILDEIKQNHLSNSQNDLEKITGQFVENVKQNVENFSYNKIIANFHEVYSGLNKLINNKIDKETWIKNYINVLIAMNPVIPHFSNECIERLGLNISENKIFWPKIDQNILVEDIINFVVQINGKTRGIIKLKTGDNEKEVLEKIKENEKLGNYIKDKLIKKTIFISNKLINIII